MMTQPKPEIEIITPKQQPPSNTIGDAAFEALTEGAAVALEAFARWLRGK